jgi:hypothetical protein
MSAADVRLQVTAGLDRLRSNGGAVFERQAKVVREAADADPRVRIGGALATGLLLGRLVNRVGR